ncbi:hypothetical protein PHMEG_00024381 [Phytophthora megakarya]|uniref:Reverse transcriptase n=1 Tax=Phytophthora megakarya TaxID=4795 RepID=A0A225VFC6_9STRA|nr:hypothetical protein PHMEG_00024381 [Phytophthora megakarya]
MTERVRKVSAFVCALGHFEWRRMPFGLKNAPMIYQRMMDNALWGFVQPKGGWKQYSERMRLAEEDVERAKAGVTESSTRPRFKFEADRESASNPDSASELVNNSIGDMFTNGEPDESSLVPEFDRRSFVDGICFGSETFDGFPEGLRADAKKIKRVTEFSFPTIKKDIRFIQDFAVYAAALYQLKEEDFEQGGDLSDCNRKSVTPRSCVVSTDRRRNT